MKGSLVSAQPLRLSLDVSYHHATQEGDTGEEERRPLPVYILQRNLHDNGTVDYDEDEAADYDDDAVDKDGHFVSTEPDILSGGKSLPLGRFLETEKVIEILQRTSVNDTLSEVPRGLLPRIKASCVCETKPQVIDKIKEEVIVKKVGEIYCSNKDVLEGPSNRRQIYNIKARSQTKGQVIPKANFADQVSALEELQHTMPFVKLIVRQYKKVLSVILYTEEKILDIKRFCCPPVTAKSTVLGFDKTFNLPNVHVTVSVYKCLAVKRRSTNDHPIFCGPLLFHGNSDKDTFFLFLHHLFGQLMDCPQVPILGSDDEKALKHAMALAFPQAARLTCTRHLKQNFSHTLADKVGLPSQERQRFNTQIFGDNGIIAMGPITWTLLTGFNTWLKAQRTALYKNW
ncbi:hypothetical protein PoB_007611600 [Plakobranchus ocellatus]|uniref:MULE transposase domain-containing protein n=1 Tax=Plakobranchus ocellatus TaxID=259542 RepID=A0AAV4DZW8_9GAST|nr:hypothetical protein PoB_007611600 [Plakobranchus ocellatus]